MSHMFCTLQEAAETLNASEDQIQALLERGLLQEFREGPHRLLKEADVDALARKQAQRRDQESPAPPPTQAEGPSLSRDPGAEAGRRASSRLPHSTIAGSRPPQAPRPQDAEGRRQRHGTSVPDRRGRPHTEGREACSHRARETTPRWPDRRPSGRMSVRQWFWIGLIQDRPLAIVLLSGGVLALLAALAAGLCFLAQAS
jgi:excisionase family DNA binding protein